MDYKELFKLCSYSEDLLIKDAPRIEKALEKAKLGPADIEIGMERLDKYFWMESAGVRKCWGIWLKQFVDIANCRDEHEKVVYYSFPLEAKMGGAINLAGHYAHSPEFVLLFLLGLMFGKVGPYFDLAEQNGMPPTSGMCGVNKMRLSSMISGIVDPYPDVVLVSSFFCDNEAKTDELIDYHFPGVPRIFVDNSLDANWDEYPNMYPEIGERRVSYLSSNFKHTIERLREDHGIILTDKHFKDAGRSMGSVFFDFQEVLECMKADPIPVPKNDMLLFYMLTTMSERRTMEEGPEAVKLLAQDARRRVEKGEGATKKGAARVAQAMPWYSDPEINQMVEEAGLAPVVSPFYWVHPKDLTKSKYSTYEDKAAETFMRMGLTHSTPGLIFRLKECVKFFELDGILWNAMYTCRPVGGHPIIIKKHMEEAGVPLLIVETDQMDSRDTPTEALRTRIETFAEMLKIRRMEKVSG